MEKLIEIRKRVKENLYKAPAIARAAEGSLSRETFVSYLGNAHYYAQFSPKIMALAASRCMNTHPELARYLLKHAEEEQGHDRWARADLIELQVREDQIDRLKVVNSCYALVGYVHYIAAFGNPVGIFGWMYVLESVGEDLGSAMTDSLKSQFGSRAGLRFVSGHAEADVGHTHDLTEQIEKYIKSDQDRKDVLQVAEVIADLYVRMFHEIVEG